MAIFSKVFGSQRLLPCIAMNSSEQDTFDPCAFHEECSIMSKQFQNPNSKSDNLMAARCGPCSVITDEEVFALWIVLFCFISYVDLF